MSRGMSRRVVIVDGNDDAAQSLAHLLRLDGHEALALRSSHDALQRIVAMEPDVVFTEMVLPGPHDGPTLCRLLRRHPALAGCTVVGLTCRCARTDRARMREAGAHFVFIKPADPDALSSLVAQASRSAWRQAEAQQHAA